MNKKKPPLSYSDSGVMILSYIITETQTGKVLCLFISRSYVCTRKRGDDVF